jgi:GNAT superfamily N-acetyltransferase
MTVTLQSVMSGAATPVHIRPAVPGDRPALVQMLARCSDRSRYLRFFAGIRSWPERYLADALSGRPDHIALVAEVAGTVVALASAVTIEGAAELGVLVEDTQQRKGIGGSLLRSLVHRLDRAGVQELTASVQVEQRWIAGVLRTFGTSAVSVHGDVFLVRLRRRPNECPLWT